MLRQYPTFSTADRLKNRFNLGAFVETRRTILSASADTKVSFLLARSEENQRPPIRSRQSFSASVENRTGRVSEKAHCIGMRKPATSGAMAFPSRPGFWREASRRNHHSRRLIACPHAAATA